MSISNLFVPNNFDLYARSINGSSPSGQLITSPIEIDTGNTLLTTPSLEIINSNASSAADNISVICNNAPSSRISIKNTNPAAISNEFVTFDNNSGFALTAGNNNADGTAFVYTGAGKDLKFGTSGTERFRLSNSNASLTIPTGQVLNISAPGYKIIRWTSQTIGAASAKSNIIIPA